MIKYIIIERNGSKKRNKLSQKERDSGRRERNHMKMRFRKIMAAILSTAMVAAAIPVSGILHVQASSPKEHIDLSRQVAGEGLSLIHISEPTRR